MSRETNLEFVDAKFLLYSQLEDFILQIRRKDRGIWTNKMFLTSQNTELLDSNGQPIELFDNSTGKKSALSSLGSISNNQDLFSPKRAKSDHFISFVSRSLAPKNGWSSVKFPVTYRAEVSDGTCWPLQIDTKVERVQMKMQDFGAAK